MCGCVDVDTSALNHSTVIVHLQPELSMKREFRVDDVHLHLHRTYNCMVI